MKKTNKELLGFLNVANIYLQSNKNKKSAIYITRQIKKVNEALEEYNDAVEDARIENCSVDEKGNIQKDSDGGYVFSREGLKKITEIGREILKKEVDVDIVLNEKGIEDMEEDYKRYFLEFIGSATEI